MRLIGNLGRQLAELQDDLEITRAEIRKTNSKIDFWKREFAKRAVKKKCSKCKGSIQLWPFETEGYYIKGNRVTHIACNQLTEKS